MKIQRVGIYSFPISLIDTSEIILISSKKIIYDEKHEKVHHFITYRFNFKQLFSKNLWTICTKIFYSILDINNLLENRQLSELKNKTRISEFNTHNTSPLFPTSLYVSIQN